MLRRINYYPSNGVPSGESQGVADGSGKRHKFGRSRIDLNFLHTVVEFNLEVGDGDDAALGYKPQLFSLQAVTTNTPTKCKNPH